MDYDLNGFEENHHLLRHSNDSSNDQDPELVNHLHFLESILHPEMSDETFHPINGHDEFNSSIDDEPDQCDEYDPPTSFLFTCSFACGMEIGFLL